jgi:hypothetical protein
MAETTSDTYLAGLWSNHMIEDLIWYESNPSRTKAELLEWLSWSVTSNYIGPSWSWTHCRMIHFQEFHIRKSSIDTDEMAVRIETNSIEATCTLENAVLNPYGRLKEGRLNVNGKMIKPPRVWRFLAFKQWEAVNAFGAALCYLDWLVEKGVKEIEVDDVFMLLLASTIVSVDAADEGEPVGNRPGAKDPDTRSSGILDFAAAGNVTAEGRKSEVPARRNAWGILLAPIENGTRYVRVGTFETAAEDGGILAFARVPFQDLEIV